MTRHQQPPPGPRPVHRADGTVILRADGSEWLSGALYIDWWIRAADKRRARAAAPTDDLPERDVETIQQHVDAALRG